MQRGSLGQEDWLAQRLPAALVPLYRFCAVIALPVAIGLAAVRMGLIIDGMAPRYAIVDFRYFYVAGLAILDGVSAYGDAYVTLGQSVYDSSFANALFYSPSVLPLLAPLGLMSAGPASAAFMALTATTIILSIAVSGWNLRHRPMVLDWRLVTAAAVVVGACVLRPSISVLFLGNAKFLMLAGLVCWMAGALRLRGSPPGSWRDDWASLLLQSVGLAVVLMKPQYGVVLFLVCVARAEWRAGAIGAVIVSGLLYTIAAIPHGLLTYGFDFLGSIAAYSGRPENSDEVLIGLYALAAQTGFSGGVIMTLTLSVLAAALILWLLPGRVDPVATGLLCVALGIFVAPTHTTDTLLLVPALLLAGAAGPLWPRLLLVGAVLVLGLIDWALPPDLTLPAATLDLRMGLATLALFATAAALMALAKQPLTTEGVAEPERPSLC
ncbi:MAG: glycosyltransferase 87 family protein [Pseudomonadota bacterium]